ncbi:GCN5-related N-acetyltransferase [Kribbella flavida DSM 17836]|uniref:GCN5-related N-acetyltransferase n=1 Tax=Kribbella flavida (strain DSM 17836 / JCM 10339 / NBRC 14399) TaxID=479435 RepID=D2PVR6_KRIFD|nr:GNAT family N-acetyltransferase [Kribbella flavida]ADB35306.1 GCN5-related N-acetyltransferase [Kribbella flavida DSM 17836]
MSTPYVRVTGDPGEFKQTVFPFLQRDPVLNTALLSNVEGRVDGLMYDPAPPVFVSVHRDEEVIGAVVCTALRGVMLGDLAVELIPAVLAAVLDSSADPVLVDGTPAVAGAFADQLAAELGRDLTEDRRTRLHELGDFVPLEAPGEARPATMDDLADAARMIGGFGADMGGRLGVEEEERWARGRIGHGQVWLWQHDGRAVSMAGHHGDVFGADRIGPVYTPPAERGRGYAGALTAHLSRHLRANGSRVCLFTDLANPTSNKIYARIGYRPVTDFVRYRLS